MKMMLSAASLLRREGWDRRSGELFAVAAYNLVRLPKLMAGARLFKAAL